MLEHELLVAEKLPIGTVEITIAVEKVGVNKDGAQLKSGFVRGICLSETNLGKQLSVIGDNSKKSVDESNFEMYAHKFQVGDISMTSSYYFIES